MSYKKRSFAAYADDNGNPPSHAPFAVYGTPLPAYDPEVRDDGSYVPVWKQEVTDERGRKRLHGAFTGGWSAGYFNTVGSKEGWTPATFVSSRSKRAGQKDGKPNEQRAEDFMDDEDLAEQAESQKLETVGAFAGLGEGGDGNGVKGMFSDLFRTTGETMGVKLLQRMGWRPGQGVGPKVKRMAQGDKTGEAHLFAPENSSMISFSRKTDRKGLGFAGEGRLGTAEQGGEKLDADSDDDSSILKRNREKMAVKPGKLKKKKKTGIGMGVLNDTGSDDEDPYAVGPLLSYNRVIGGDKKTKKKSGLGTGNSQIATPRPTFTSKKLGQQSTVGAAGSSSLAGFRKCHDGRLPLDGFELAGSPISMLQENQYPPPVVPEGWSSSKATGKSSSRDKPFQSTADAAKVSTLDHKGRAALLGEQQLPGKSVFDFISPAVRDRLASAAGKASLPRGLGESAPAGFEKNESETKRTLWDLVPPLDKETAIAALQRSNTGWMPYSEDEAKRDRYKTFLELRAGVQGSLPERAKGFSLEEWSKEMREFAQAAEVFKPISGLMATRFTSSSSAPKLASDEPEKAPQKAEDPADKAAKMGMYGPMTRSTSPFYPTRLLCKRFNVRPPAGVTVDPGSTPGGNKEAVPESRRLDVVSQASLERMMREASFRTPTSTSAGADVSKSGVEHAASTSVATGPRATLDAESNAALEAQRPDEAVFKAVFADEDVDE